MNNKINLQKMWGGLVNYASLININLQYDDILFAGWVRELEVLAVRLKKLDHPGTHHIIADIEKLSKQILKFKNKR